MSRFIYMLSEGVHDVAFLTRVLKHIHGATRIERKSELDEPRRLWVEAFKWPVGETIGRLSVPAPAFVRLAPSDTLIGLRNAGGITNLKDTLENDLEMLYKHKALPDTIGVFLDSDKEPQGARYQSLCSELRSISPAFGPLQLAEELARIGAGNPRVGIFAFPRPGKEYVETWKARVESDGHKDWKELKGESGIKKATFAAATAILKPGRAASTTIEDNRWIGDATRDHEALAPCLAFLNELLASPEEAMDLATA